MKFKTGKSIDATWRLREDHMQDVAELTTPYNHFFDITTNAVNLAIHDVRRATYIEIERETAYKKTQGTGPR